MFDGLFRAVVFMGIIYFAGAAATLVYNLIMVKVSQGTLKDIRDDMFEHMQSLPIRYFDQHSHGDIMSYYSNDIDTLRQMISQSLPNVFTSIVSLIAVFFSMMYLSVWLTAIVLVFMGLVLLIVRHIAGNSGAYFVEQQKSLGKVNGYIEEMIHGLKVVKVFNYEEKAKEEFDILNDELAKNATEANRYAYVLMPIMNNLGCEMPKYSLLVQVELVVLSLSIR